MTKRVAGWSGGWAAEWLRARPPRWADPRWSAAGWGTQVVALVGAATTDDTILCSETVACTADWPSAIVGTLVVAHVAWIALAPGIGWVTAPLAILVAAVFPGLILMDSAAWTLVLTPLAAVWTLATLYLRERGRRRQQAIAAPRATTLPGLPHPLPPASYRYVKLIAPVVVLAAAASLVAYSRHLQRQDEARAHGAERVSAKVLAHLDDGVAVRVKVPDGADWTLETFDAAGYPVGSTVTVLVDGDWARIASEPYDPTSGWGLLGLLVGWLAVPLAGTAIAWRWRLRRLASGPVPALRVQLVPDHKGNPVVYATTDRKLDLPLLTLPAEISTDDVDEDEDEDRPYRDLLLRKEVERQQRPDTAILFGLPYDGATLAAQFTGKRPAMLTPTGPARPSEHVAAILEAEIIDRSRDVARSLPAGAAPRTWRGAVAARVFGWLLVTAAFLFAAWFAATAEDFAESLIALGGLFLIHSGLMRQRWRIVADSHGVTVAGATRTRSLAWHELDLADPSTGDLVIHARDASRDIHVAGPSDSWLTRWLRPDHGVAEIAAIINALRADPQLRPRQLATDAHRSYLFLGLAAAYVAVVLVAGAVFAG